MSILSSTSGSALSTFFNSSRFGTLSVGGLISGIDTTKVIQGLLAIEQQKIEDISRKEAVLQNQQTAFKNLEAKLLVFQGQVAGLARTQNGVFDARSVQVSDTGAIAAAASSTAVAGDYHLRINALAQSHQIASQGFNRTTSAITHGSMSLTIGDTTTNITVDGSNDTLQGLANTINASGAAVNAAIVNDGSGDDQQGYRLILTSKATGIANRIVLTNNLANGASKPRFDANAISAAIAKTGNSGTSAVQSNVGTGYTGSSNNVYQFTVTQGGTVGTDDGIHLAYTDGDGTHTGTITLNSGDADVLKLAAQGIGIQFGAGTLVAGDTFTVKAFVPTVQAAADSSVTLGTGSGAFTVTNSSNKIDGLISGLTLSLKQADANKDLTLTVANDTDGITKAIQGFVNSYNDVVSYINQQTAYDSNTKQAGPLLGNLQAISIEEQLRNAVQSVVTGATPGMNYLGALGISTNDAGQLVLNNDKLATVLAGNKPGVTLDDVRKLFALTGSTSNSGITFVSASAKTHASTTPYTVEITQAAEQASLTAPTSLAASTIIDNTNNTLTVSVDGASSGVLTIAAGTYSRSGLAQAIQSAINASFGTTGKQVTVGVTADKVTVASNRYGSASRVTITSGSSLTALGFAGGENDQGLDVAGRYVANIVTETATGTGQFLLGDSNNSNTAGLQLRVALTPAQVGAGVQANVTVTRGVAAQLGGHLDNLFDPINGRLKTIDDGFATRIQALEEDKTNAIDLMNARQAQLQTQFNAMERTLAQLQSASNFLNSQAASLAKK